MRKRFSYDIFCCRNALRELASPAPDTVQWPCQTRAEGMFSSSEDTRRLRINIAKQPMMRMSLTARPTSGQSSKLRGQLQEVRCGKHIAWQPCREPWLEKGSAREQEFNRICRSAVRLAASLTRAGSSAWLVGGWDPGCRGDGGDTLDDVWQLKMAGTPRWERVQLQVAEQIDA